MAWSWKIGRLAGINIYMHWTFLLLIAFIVYLYISQGASGMAAALGVLFVLAVFGCVVLHELGHALAARRYGVPTRDITLLPIGGIARMQRMPDHPGQELVVAIAGPLVNVAIGILLAMVLLAMGELGRAAPTGLLEIGRGNFLANLMWINFILVLFNMLPAFPMDGGRVLRSLLAMWLDYATATSIAAGAGQIMAILFGLLGLLAGNPILIFIALFVFLGAGAETQQAQIRSLLAHVPVEEAMLSRFRTLDVQDPLGVAVDELLAGSQHDFPVFENGRYVGMLVRKDLLENLDAHGRDYAIAHCISQECPTAERNDPLDEVIRSMQEAGCATMPIFAGGEFVGVLTLENIGEYMMVRSALKHQRGPREHARLTAPKGAGGNSFPAPRAGHQAPGQ